MRTVMNGQDWAILLFLAAIWGGSFFFNGIAVHDLPSLTIVWLRVTIAAATLLVTLAITGVRLPRDPAIWAAFFVMGLFNSAIPYALLVWGQHHIASGLAAILNATTPLFTVLAAHFFTTDEKLTRLKLLGVLIGFAGTAVMIGPDALSLSGAAALGEAACLGASISYAIAGIFGRRFRRLGLPPLVAATGQIASAAIILLPAALLVDRPWSLAAPHAVTWAAILALGMVSTAFAYTLFFRLLGSVGASNVALVTFLVPVGAVLLGVLVLGEVLYWRELAGVLLIGLGLACIDGRLVRFAFGGRTAPA